MLSRKHMAVLRAVFADPVRANIAWRDIEALFVALGAEVSEGSGSRVRVVLGGVRAVFHRPHPEKETDRGAVRSVRRFLTESGVSI
jgi:CO dehydrogenase/acetyl-CoA synthase delta subunit